jgi:hypothetical protein
LGVEVEATLNSEDMCPVCTVMLRLVLGVAEVVESSWSFGGIAECRFMDSEDTAS